MSDLFDELLTHCVAENERLRAEYTAKLERTEERFSSLENAVFAEAEMDDRLVLQPVVSR